MRVLLLGTNHESTALAYKDFNYAPSCLVNNDIQDYIIGHTSRQEFTSDIEFELVLSRANEIYWTFPDIKLFNSAEEYYVLLNWLKEYNLKYNNIKNFSNIIQDPYNWNVELPNFTINDIVFYGSSTTAGNGVLNTNERYTTIIADYFKKNCINIAERFSNTIGTNDKSFDLFTQSNLVEGQIVVYHIPPLYRFRYCKEDNMLVDKQLFDKTGLKNHKQIVDVYTKQHLVYNMISKIRSIIKISRLLKLKFVFFFDNYKDLKSIDLVDQSYFYEMPEFIPYHIMSDKFYLDVGEVDQTHPGVKSNKAAAEAIIKYIEQIYGK